MKTHSRVAFVCLVFVVDCAISTALLAIEKDNFAGTCQELADHIKDVGVKDAKGNHPGWPGSTVTEIQGKGSASGTKQTTQTTFFCPANNKFYDTTTECQKPPSMGGCRTVIGTIPCQPRTAVCLDADAKITFPGTHTSTRLEWKTKGQSKACKKDIERWYEHVATHEAKHVKDAKSHVSKWNEDYKKKHFSACGGTKDEAKAKLEAAIADAVETGSNSLREAIKEAAKTFHKSQEGGPATRPSCDLCK